MSGFSLPFCRLSGSRLAVPTCHCLPLQPTAAYLRQHTGTDIQQPEPNRYGCIPYILLRLRQPRKGYYGSGLFKLAEANIRCNAIQYQTLYKATYNALSVWIARNLDWENNGGLLDPGEVIVIEDERGPSDGGDMPGELNSVSADTAFTEIDEMISSSPA